MSQIDPDNSHAQRPPRQALGWAAVVGAFLLAGVAWTYRPAPLPKENLEPEKESSVPTVAKETPWMPKIVKSDEQWRSQLTDEQFEVTRNKGTERAFSGKYWNTKEPGSYKCVCCGAELFTSDTKYDSGCGWPSFFASDKPDNLQTLADHSHGMARVEVQCKQCGAHLGHLFDDGPAPTGQRYCMNSASLNFEKKEAEAKEAEKPTK